MGEEDDGFHFLNAFCISEFLRKAWQNLSASH